MSGGGGGRFSYRRVDLARLNSSPREQFNRIEFFKTKEEGEEGRL